MVPRIVADETFVLIFSIVQSLNQMFRVLYRGGAWLDRVHASQVATLGLRSLRAYHKLARLHLALKIPRFPIHSKFHYLFHTFRFLEINSRTCEWSESPLVDVCAQDESFIGIIARYSRRVGAGATIDRTWDLYITSLHERWDE